MNSNFKAGLFVLAALASMIYLTTKVTQNKFAFRGTHRFYAVIKDATGLLNKGKVKLAGLDVGQIESIDLENKQARLTLVIGGDVQVFKDAHVSLRTIGFLGDKYLALFSGNEATGVLPEGAVIAEVADGKTLEDLTEKVGKVIENVSEITDVLKKALKGDEVDGTTRLERIAENIEDFSAGLAGLNRLGDLTNKLNDIGDDIKFMTAKIRRGEGTVGKLINDSETIDKINTAVSSVNKFLTKADRLQIFLDAKTAALTSTGGAKTFVQLLIQPAYDKYYLLGVTSGPQGFTTRSHVDTVSNGTTVSTSETTLQQKSVVTYNVQFAKMFGDLIFRAGLFESTGGLAADYVGLLDHRIKFITELYNFQPDRQPQLNIGTELHVFKPFYFWGGGDDILARGRRNAFIGAGLRFSDADVKTLFTSFPRN